MVTYTSKETSKSLWNLMVCLLRCGPIRFLEQTTSRLQSVEQVSRRRCQDTAWVYQGLQKARPKRTCRKFLNQLKSHYPPKHSPSLIHLENWRLSNVMNCLHLNQHLPHPHLLRRNGSNFPLALSSQIITRSRKLRRYLSSHPLPFPFLSPSQALKSIHLSFGETNRSLSLHQSPQ